MWTGSGIASATATWRWWWTTTGGGWSGPAPGAKALQAFFGLLGPEGCQQIELVTMDMSAGYRKAVDAWLPQAQVVYDRFHAAKPAHEAVDEVGREQPRELGGTPQGMVLSGSRFALWKNPWDLTARQRRQLAGIERHNRRLYRAYPLKEALARLLDYQQAGCARQALKDRLGWASRSRLRPLRRPARTVPKHAEGILAYIEERLTHGLTEGLNRKIRAVTTRAYGFHSPEALTAMDDLSCSRIPLFPALP